MSNIVDKYMKEFSNECLEVLKTYDQRIRDNLTLTEHKDFYGFAKGIAVYSITEPIIKFLIFSSLCKQYMIWPEVGEFYKDRKYLDLALYLPNELKRQVNSSEDEPDIAIEMKWGGLKKTGEFMKWGLDNFIDDMLKLHKNCTIKNKYIMQFIILHNDIEIDVEMLKEQILSNVDKRSFRGKDIELVYMNYFDTHGVNESELWSFYIVLWKIK